MSDILDKIVAVKRQEVAAALKRKPLELVRADAESRVLTRDFVGALRAKIAAGRPAAAAAQPAAEADRITELGRLVRLRHAQLLDEQGYKALEAGDRALIFTQFTQMGNILVSTIPHLMGIPVLYLHGGTPAAMRDQMVRRFQEDEHGPQLFILSLKAGGLGLNLTRASHVFHFDRWWNSAVEDQATDRTYRIGQHQNVTVHKFITVGTLEEKIDELIESKKGLAEAVLGTGEQWLTELTTDELRELVSLRRQA